METKFTLGTVLDIIFSYTTTGPRKLAEQYVDRHRSLIYKWRLDQAFPTKELFPGIIEFAVRESSESSHQAMRGRIDACILSSSLSSARKQQIMEEESFRNYLMNVFNELAILWREKGDTVDSPEKNGLEATVFSVIPRVAEDEEKLVSLQTGEAQTEDIPLNPEPEHPRSGEFAIHITLSHTTLLTMFLAAVACFAGDGLWAVLSWALGWPGDAWMRGGGLPAFLWGLLFALPVVELAMLSLRGRGPRGVGKKGRLLLAAGFTAAGGMAALLLALSAPGLFLAGQAGSAVRDLLLVFISAFVMTFLPILTLLALLRFPRVRTVPFLLMELGPALMCTLFSFPVVLTGTWFDKAFWLGGFLAGAAAKLMMFFAVWLTLKGYPDEIGMDFFRVPQV
ncbi:MAG: hypothetical protein QM270_11350 [Bacillota bacterium]|nr:hypothetical protein [Bacillota bacterium]